MPNTNMRDLSFATFNLFNLQRPGERTYSNYPHFADDAEGWDEYRKKIEWIGRALRLLDAEVIAFQELWSKRALEEAFEAAGLLGDYELVARDAPGRGRPQVAMAVRKGRFGQSQIGGEPEWLAEFPDGFVFDHLRETDGAEEEITLTIREFSRPVLHVVVQPEGRGAPSVDIYVVHFKSKGPARLSFARPRPEALQKYAAITRAAVAHIRRVMEAAALRAILDAKMKSAEADDLSPVVVLGDLNDGSLAVSTELLTNQPSFRLAAKSRAGESSDRGLYTVEMLQQYRSLRHVYYTHIFKNKLESLDHILVSEEFYDHSKKRHWSFREMEVYNDHLHREKFKEIGAGDHGLVRAYFDWNPVD